MLIRRSGEQLTQWSFVISRKNIGRYRAGETILLGGILGGSRYTISAILVVTQWITVIYRVDDSGFNHLTDRIVHLSRHRQRQPPHLVFLKGLSQTLTSIQAP